MFDNIQIFTAHAQEDLLATQPSSTFQLNSFV